MDDVASIKERLKGVDPDVAMEIFNRGYQNGNEHKSSSPQTLHALNKIKKDITMQYENTNNKIDGIKDNITEIKVLLTGMPEKIFEKADNRYASKGEVDFVKVENEKVTATLTKVLWAVATVVTGFTIELIRNIFLNK